MRVVPVINSKMSNKNIFLLSLKMLIQDSLKCLLNEACVIVVLMVCEELEMIFSDHKRILHQKYEADKDKFLYFNY